MRSAAIDAGFAVADRLNRVGLGSVTHRARRLAARLGPDEHRVEVDGLVVCGSLSGHGTYLRSLSGPVGSSYELELIERIVEPGATVVDCGAHLGLHAFHAARAAGPNGTVIAVEAAPPTAAALRRGVAANGFADRVEVVEAAAVAEPGTVRLDMDPHLDQTGIADGVTTRGRMIDVRGVRLDDLLGERPFDLAKIDVEGGEAGAIAGLERGLARSPGATVLLECHPDRLRALGTDPVDWLCELGGRGPLDLLGLDRRLVPIPGREAIEGLVRDRPLAFNLRWKVG